MKTTNISCFNENVIFTMLGFQKHEFKGKVIKVVYKDYKKYLLYTSNV